MPSRFLPGKYFEYKAQFYLKKKDYRISLEMSKLASYWGIKTAQYIVGILYFTGNGIAEDKPRGAAWLRIATEHKNPLAERALALANEEMTLQQRTEAEAIWRELDVKYGDAVTLPRARAYFEAEKRNATGSMVGFVGAMRVISADGVTSGTNYYANQQKEFDAFVEENFGHGHVDVEPIEQLDTPASH